MVRWQADLRPSRWAQWLSLILHSGVMLVLLLTLWPNRYILLRVMLPVLIVTEAAGSLRRIRARKGEIVLLEECRLCWREQQWRITHRSWMGQQAIFLTLRGERYQRAHLWLMSDSMSGREWRQLRLHLRNEMYRR